MATRSVKESLRLMLPVIWEARTDSQEFEAVLDWLTKGFENTKTKIDLIDSLYDVESCPAEYLPYLAYFLGLNLEYAINSDEVFLREQIRQASSWYKLKNTKAGIELMMLSLGFTAQVKELWWDESYEYENLSDTKPSTYHPLTPAGGSKSHFFDIDFNPIQESGQLNSDEIIRMKALIERVKPLTAVLRKIDYILLFADTVEWLIQDDLTLENENFFRDEFKLGKEWCLYHDAVAKNIKHTYSDRLLVSNLAVAITSQPTLSQIETTSSVSANVSSGDYLMIEDGMTSSPPLLVDYVDGTTVYIQAGYLNETKGRDFPINASVFKLEVLVRNNIQTLRNIAPVAEEFVYRDSTFVMRDGTITDRTGTLTYTHPVSGEERFYMHDYNLLTGYDRSCGGQNYFEDGYQGDALEISGERDIGSDTVDPFSDQFSDEHDFELYSNWPAVSEEVVVESKQRLTTDVYNWGEEVTRGVWQYQYEPRDGSYLRDGELSSRGGEELLGVRTRGEEPTYFDRSGSLMPQRDGSHLRDGSISRSGSIISRETLYNEGYMHNYKVISGIRRDYGGRYTADELVVALEDA